MTGRRGHRGEGRRVIPTGSRASKRNAAKRVGEGERESAGRAVELAGKRAGLSGRFGEVIAGIALDLVGLVGHRLDRAITGAMRRIGRVMGVDRSYLFLYSEDGRVMWNTHEWVARGIESHKSMFQNLPVQRYPWFDRQIRRRAFFQIPRVDQMPETAAAERRLFMRHRIRSMLFVGLRTEKRLLGFIGFDCQRTERVWSTEEIRMVQIVAGVLAAAIEHNRTHRRLRRSRRRLKAILAALPDRIVLTDRRGRIVAVPNEGRSVPGLLPASQILGRNIRELVPSPQWARLVRAVARTLKTRRIQVAQMELATDEGPAYFEIRHVPVGRSLVLAMVRDISDAVRAEKALQQQAVQLRRLAAELTLAEERQRRLFAVELHDTISQELAMARQQLVQLRQSLTGPVDALEQSLRLVEQALSHTQSLTFDLSPAVLYELGLPAALRAEGRKLSEQHHLEFEFVQSGTWPKLPSELQVLLFRIVRELMINVVKHAQADWMRVRVAGNRRGLRIRVEDNGKGMDLTVPVQREGGGGFGLFSIRERLVLIGGKLELQNRRGGGTVAVVSVPWPGRGKGRDSWPEMAGHANTSGR